MLMTFADLIEWRGFDLQRTRLVRHNNEALMAWRGSKQQFQSFVSFQKDRPDARSPYNGADLAFHFLPAKPLNDGDAAARFVGATYIGDSWRWDGERLPVLYDPDHEEPLTEHTFAYDLAWLDSWDNLAEKLVINWGRSPRNWSQWAAQNTKPIIEYRHEKYEAPFPGFSNFRAITSEISLLPETWLNALASVKGIYILIDERGRQYIGSATGANGFLERWRAYEIDGHGGNVLLKQKAGKAIPVYEVAILEVASPDMSSRDILNREKAWKEKLGSRAYGLNAN